MQESHLVLHAVAIKKHATPTAVTELTGLPPDRVVTLLNDAVSRGRLREVQGKFVLTPTAMMALAGEYSRIYAEQRCNAEFKAAFDAFERVNIDLKALITDWQTLDVGGQRVPNDHSDAEHDERIIDRLGSLHERADKVLIELIRHLPRLKAYRDKLRTALEKAEDGDHRWVSDAKLDSYHTIWFELHEDLLRILGRQRKE